MLVSGKVAEKGVSQETGPWRRQPLSRPEGDEGAIMPVASSLLACPFARPPPPALHPRVRFILLSASVAQAASIRGIVTDATGAKVTGASVVLVSNGQVIASAVSTADGSFQILTGTSGRFFLVVSATSFRQLQTPDFYAGPSTALSATSCSSRSGHASPSLSPQPERQPRNRRPAPPPACLARSTLLCATISLALCASCPAPPS